MNFPRQKYLYAWGLESITSTIDSVVKATQPWASEGRQRRHFPLDFEIWYFAMNIPVDAKFSLRITELEKWNFTPIAPPLEKSFRRPRAQRPSEELVGAAHETNLPPIAEEILVKIFLCRIVVIQHLCVKRHHFFGFGLKFEDFAFNEIKRGGSVKTNTIHFVPLVKK